MTYLVRVVPKLIDILTHAQFCHNYIINKCVFPSLRDGDASGF